MVTFLNDAGATFREKRKFAEAGNRYMYVSNGMNSSYDMGTTD
ncbi:hypothetical protein J43TS9_61100 [Paenibacillus cineris]|nr:hypothetical protein J43TS9_61100 [Paenibacillus cineris]